MKNDQLPMDTAISLRCQNLRRHKFCRAKNIGSLLCTQQHKTSKNVLQKSLKSFDQTMANNRSLIIKIPFGAIRYSIKMNSWKHFNLHLTTRMPIAPKCIFVCPITHFLNQTGEFWFKVVWFTNIRSESKPQACAKARSEKLLLICLSYLGKQW